MTVPKIAIIIGTTRPNRFGDKPAQWIYDLAAARSEIDTEILDLRDFPLPFFGEEDANAVIPQWKSKVGEFDGYVFITAEYNHSITGVLKNALDHGFAEWNRKPAVFVGYGGVGGARAVEQLRLICVELQIAPLRPAVHIQGADFMAVMKGKYLGEIEYLQAGANAMLDDLLWWTTALKAARAQV